MFDRFSLSLSFSLSNALLPERGKSGSFPADTRMLRVPPDFVEGHSARRHVRRVIRRARRERDIIVKCQSRQLEQSWHDWLTLFTNTARFSRISLFHVLYLALSFSLTQIVYFPRQSISQFGEQESFLCLRQLRLWIVDVARWHNSSYPSSTVVPHSVFQVSAFLH